MKFNSIGQNSGNTDTKHRLNFLQVLPNNPADSSKEKCHFVTTDGSQNTHKRLIYILLSIKKYF